MTYINMHEVFSSADKRKAEAEAFIAMFTDEQVAEASRIASLYCAAGSIRHKVLIAKELKLFASI
jgi:hypothetical protein